MNPFDEPSTSDEIRQGFLCPMCMRDMGDAEQLMAHVDAEHGKENGQTAGNNVRNLFDRAKARLLQFDSFNLDGDRDRATSVNQSVAPVKVNNVELNVDQPLGRTSSHTNDFHRWRESQVNEDEVQTNQLIIRVDKLINECPLDPSQRKAFEREVVPWAMDASLENCPTCHKSFTALTRRRHHCRTCGTLMCSECTARLPTLIARKLVNPALCSGDDLPSSWSPIPSSSGSSGDSGNVVDKGKMKVLQFAQFIKKKTNDTIREVNEDTNSSIGGDLNSQTHIRVCRRCKHLLERRDAQMSLRHTPTTIVQVYERLRDSIDQLARVYPSYCRTADSLNRGESLYTLDDGKTLKLSVMHLQGEIDQLSRAVLAMDCAQSTRQSLVQGNVRNHAVNVVRGGCRTVDLQLAEIILTMPSLPDTVELSSLQASYKSRLTERIGREREQLVRRTSRWRDEDEGWTGDGREQNAPGSQEEDDPLQQQLLIIKGYLRQALAAGRNAEADMLERNLRELQVEIDRQKSE